MVFGTDLSSSEGKESPTIFSRRGRPMSVFQQLVLRRLLVFARRSLHLTLARQSDFVANNVFLRWSIVESRGKRPILRGSFFHAIGLASSPIGQRFSAIHADSDHADIVCRRNAHLLREMAPLSSQFRLLHSCATSRSGNFSVPQFLGPATSQFRNSSVLQPTFTHKS